MMNFDKFAEIYELVKKKYNVNVSLKNEQREVVKSLMSGRNVVSILPTGFGKSLTFVLPPLLFDEVSRVVTVYL